MTAPTVLATALTVATLALPALPAVAQAVFVPPPPSAATSGPLAGKRSHVAQELRLLGYFDVDMRSLSNGQVAHIDNIIHSGLSQGAVRGQVGTVLRGGGILQRVIDGLGRR